MAVSTSASPVLDELRQLFSRGEHDALVVRVDHLQKRKRTEDATTKHIIDATRAFSLIHLGRSEEALPILQSLPADDAALARHVSYAKLYASWAVNENVTEAIDQASDLSGDDAKRLEAQLLYRGGRYTDAAEHYAALLKAAKDTLEEKKRPAATSRWGLASVTGRAKPAPTPVTAAELDQLASAVNELATNTMAAQVLAGRNDEAVSLGTGLRASYELEYNAACARIARAEYENAETGLEKAEALIRAELDDEDDDVEEAIAPVKVQKAYFQHLAGDVNAAERCYAAIMAERKADAASLAVAANNLTVALGQLAFGRKGEEDVADGVGKDGKVLPKEQHEALAEGLKKMRATSGRNVERKLTTSQRRAMARNRAVLLVQMGRLDACRAELARVKSEFPDDPCVPLIEATLVARQSNLDTADKILRLAGDNESVRAARVQLAASNGDRKRAAGLLEELFPDRPAAIVTAAALLEEDGDVDSALTKLRALVSTATGPAAAPAKKVLAKALLRNRKYEEAAAVLREVCKTDPHDSVAQAQFVAATSYFNPSEAEEAASRLPAISSTTRTVDAKQLESLPPPKRKHTSGRKTVEPNGVKVSEDDAAARAAAARERKKRKRKKRLPKNYDPEGPPPDPERWLPKTLRSGYKKKKAKEQNNFRGSQGADAAATEAAARKNAERSAAKAAAATSDGPLPPSGRPKLQRKKKNRR